MEEKQTKKTGRISVPRSSVRSHAIGELKNEEFPFLVHKLCVI